MIDLSGLLDQLTRISCISGHACSLFLKKKGFGMEKANVM